MASDDSVEHDLHALDLHLREYFPDRAMEDFRWTLGPIEQVLPHFRVRRIAPASPDDGWLYVTLGACTVSTGGQRVEFMIESPEETPRIVETLAIVAHSHATSGHPYHVGRTIDLGRPWLDGATATNFLVDHPFLYEPDVEWCRLGEESVQFVWLVPITTAEAGFARRDGADALTDLLEQRQADVLDPGRPSVV